MGTPLSEYVSKLGKTVEELSIDEIRKFESWYQAKSQVEKDKWIERITSQQKIAQKVYEERQRIRSMSVENKVVCEIGLCQIDIDAVKWALKEIEENYDIVKSVYGKPLMNLKESLRML